MKHLYLKKILWNDENCTKDTVIGVKYARSFDGYRFKLASLASNHITFINKFEVDSNVLGIDEYGSSKFIAHEVSDLEAEIENLLFFEGLFKLDNPSKVPDDIFLLNSYTNHGVSVAVINNSSIVTYYICKLLIDYIRAVRFVTNIIEIYFYDIDYNVVALRYKITDLERFKILFAKYCLLEG